jgi:translation initiation factor 4A
VAAASDRRWLPQTPPALFSATMPEDVLELTKKFMRNPTRILVKCDNLTLEGMRQYFVAVEEDHKLDTLMDLCGSFSTGQFIIFANTRHKVVWIAEQLNQHNHTASSMHAETAKGEREKVMSTFRSGSFRVLVTTDLVASGNDVHVNIVINIDLPSKKENYLHRIGRGGHYGRTGIAINFVSSRDVELLKEIEEHFHTQIEELPKGFANLGE